MGTLGFESFHHKKIPLGSNGGNHGASGAPRPPPLAATSNLKHIKQSPVSQYMLPAPPL